MYPNLRAEIARKGIKQSEIAVALDIGNAAVSQRMNGHVDWKLTECKKLAELLRYDGTIDDLFDVCRDYPYIG